MAGGTGQFVGFVVLWLNLDREQRRFWRDRAVSPEPSLLAHTSSESRGTFRQKVRSLAPLNGWACAVKICHDGMLEDTNLLDAAHLILFLFLFSQVNEVDGKSFAASVEYHRFFSIVTVVKQIWRVFDENSWIIFVSSP